MTATRTNEEFGAKWEEIDLDRAIWTIPADRMKAGREHRVPLAAQCVGILQLAEELMGGSDYVFRDG